MPAYNFKKQFAPAVEEGTKRQTIRKRRKNPTKPGDRLFHYTGMRTKHCRKLIEADCLSVHPFEILLSGGIPVVTVRGRVCQGDDLLSLAIADGFSSVEDFVGFFESHYGLPFRDAEIIKW